MALLQSVADKLVAESKSRQTAVDKAIDFAKRINWLRLGKLILPTTYGAVVGGTIAGPVGALLGAASGLIKGTGQPSAEDIEKLRVAYEAVQPELVGILKDKEQTSLPEEISALRNTFEDLLKTMDITLIVLVDDLDRCLPSTAISTLEAMRLLLFLKRTAFIIAADEEMIRGAVRAHFNDIDLTEDLVTSYFDKLIQIPLQVPRLGVIEVKAFLILLLSDLAKQRGDITTEELAEAEKVVLLAARQPWVGGLTRKKMQEAFGAKAAKLSREIDLADQLASIMVSAERIAGNPRLIKRFLNNLLIRDAVAKAQGMAISFDQLVKLQLFERNASSAAFDYLIKQLAASEDGKAAFIAKIEETLTKDEVYQAPDKSWDSPFILEWLKLNPKLGAVDLRPLLYLSRDRSLSLARFDEISPEGKALLEAILEAKIFMQPLVDQLKSLDEMDAERILTRIIRQARSDQWDRTRLIQAFHVPKAFPSLGATFVNFLNEIPADQRPAPLIPLIKDEAWAQEMLQQWSADQRSSQQVKKAIGSLKGGA